MSFKYIAKIPTADEIKAMIPLESKLAQIKAGRDARIKKIFTGESDKFLLVIGPCSADVDDTVCEYVLKLAEIQEKVADKIVIVPRIYTNKPRTTGEGYKGMMHQPDLSEEPNVLEGIKAIRKLHIRIMSETGLSGADEMLYPNNDPYVCDLLSYVAVGARSVENQQHRITASGLDIPVGMKNPTSGDISVMLNSIQATQMPHRFIYDQHEVETSGNPLSHAILRGAVNQYGKNIPNYHYEDLHHLAEDYAKRGLLNPALVIDTNHANSMKRYEEQPRIAMEVLWSKKNSQTLGKLIKGLMIESYLQDGRQDSLIVPGKSITDACIGWKKTEKLIYQIAEML
ncbi:phospho-2-dehydro-3-deoxyheptonate aldolase, Tyr-sensitive (plasmid) [Peptoclostridium acidaminophilum DSM 3953]|uniref:Phospho-2-dehydro-3-deoxyheptonate aldolase n=1 Tax=Peptoclostridium acidaminophilum DSM 3953 TaxID=1286171 RepID=W8TK38_PEPAC|nr:3-deoxy-7-phosphoheptulonate synthase [Peptoclostridium acidaminophilum]AHM58113.1 phospho-2-dehydro-3-deoxyheptonate aldolase, Tyr-sensitive [Peptoclostridium acidaminophilum DSM 3953]